MSQNSLLRREKASARPSTGRVRAHHAPRLAVCSQQLQHPSSPGAQGEGSGGSSCVTEPRQLLAFLTCKGGTLSHHYLYSYALKKCLQHRVAEKWYENNCTDFYFYF